MKPTRLQRPHERGATTVEFALSALILMTIVIGVMNMCLAIFSYHLVAQAARDGSRYAMVRGNTCSAAGASCTISAAAVQTYLQNQGYPGIVPANLTVTTTYSAYPSGTTCSPNLNCENPGNLVKVKVVYAYDLHIPFMPRNTLQLTSSSAMVISQ